MLGSAVAMDKEFTKKLLAAEGLPVGPYAVVRAGASLAAADRDRLGLPVFVKPARGGSSIGISRVDDWAELPAALAAARAVDVEGAGRGRGAGAGDRARGAGGARRRARRT